MNRCRRQLSFAFHFPEEEGQSRYFIQSDSVTMERVRCVTMRI